MKYHFLIKRKKGLIRNLLIRTGYHNELMVLVQFFKNDLKKLIFNESLKK